jgi:hypothetical protein
LHALAQFLLRYVILSKPKELLMNELEYAQAEAYKQDPTKEKQDKFKCALDYYSPIRVAMVWMKYENHHKEWNDRGMNVNASQRESSKCTSKFTSINTGEERQAIPMLETTV